MSNLTLPRPHQCVSKLVDVVRTIKDSQIEDRESLMGMNCISQDTLVSLTDIGDSILQDDIREISNIWQIDNLLFKRQDIILSDVLYPNIDFISYSFLKEVPFNTRFHDCPETLPPPSKDTKITIYLDLDETLVHVGVRSEKCKEPFLNPDTLVTYLPYGSSNYSYFVRKGTESFLREISKLEGVEIIAWTASLFFHAQRVLHIIDPDEKYIKYVICRSDKWCYEGSTFVKDISKVFHRNVETSILIDDCPYASKYTNLTLTVPRFENPYIEDSILDSVLCIIKRAHKVLNMINNCCCHHKTKLLETSKSTLDPEKETILSFYTNDVYIFSKDEKCHLSKIYNNFSTLIITHPLVIGAGFGSKILGKYDDIILYVLDISSFAGDERIKKYKTLRNSVRFLEEPCVFEKIRMQ